MLPWPHRNGDRWLIDQGTVSLKDSSVVHSFQFSGRFYALFFWLFALLMRFVFPVFSDGKPHTSTSNWRFSGRGLEHHREYAFQAAAKGVDAELLRPDLALAKALDGLGISRVEPHDWGCCDQLKVKSTEYLPVAERPE